LRDTFVGGARQMGGGSMSPWRLPAAATEASSLEDANFKSARITVEERREKIHRYIKKRNERNFSKKIKVTRRHARTMHRFERFKIQPRPCMLLTPLQPPTIAVRLQKDPGGQQAPRPRQIRQERRLRRAVEGDAEPRGIRPHGKCSNVMKHKFSSKFYKTACLK
jgi:hypothetical protein